MSGLRGHMGATPLHAARVGEVTAVLLSYGASLDARDGEGRTPLHNARVVRGKPAPATRPRPLEQAARRFGYRGQISSIRSATELMMRDGRNG
ncbi:ankyrin repeat domain-containing protein [Actinoplanes subtropicus]|uniref:ankyrin repeat domain-containing protein n=1 Tax=Actinoplanes subtropicus TaxID=543632 RepID=UPI001B8053BC|nr:ankyrin repeat domain-containing protein [Actinoplanes subtropicus]